MPHPELLALTPMDILNPLWTGIVFMLMISALVAAHEYGHYLFARIFKMGVEEFSIGFGSPKLKTWMRKTYSTPEGDETTEFTLRPWPVGGFVRIKGMTPEEDGSEVEVPGGFYRRAPWQRLIVLAAGPAFSILFGILILTTLYSTYGVRRDINEPIIGQIAPEGPAYKAGLRLGDRILAVDGKPVNTFFEIIQQVRTHPGIPLQVAYQRDGVTSTLTVTPILGERPSPVVDSDLQLTSEMKQQGLWYAQWTTTKVRLMPFEALGEAAKEPVRAVTGLAHVAKKPQTLPDNISGPGTIVMVTGTMVQQGLEQVLWLAAMLSISVGIMNLLPIHPLDGGQMVVAFTELLRGGRRLTFQVQNIVSAVGLVLILLIFAGALLGDVKTFQRVQEMSSKKK